MRCCQTRVRSIRVPHAVLTSFACGRVPIEESSLPPLQCRALTYPILVPLLRPHPMAPRCILALLTCGSPARAPTPNCLRPLVELCLEWQELPPNAANTRKGSRERAHNRFPCNAYLYDHTVHISIWEGFGTLLVANGTSDVLLDPVLYGGYTV